MRQSNLDNLPDRYRTSWREPFDTPILERLVSGSSVLDIGSGRHPAIELERRPVGVRYVGLDVSREELLAAPPDAYSEIVTADATVRQDSLVGQFNLVISWQVLEHVSDLELTLDNAYAYLQPGGLFVALFSGSRSVFAVVNRILPNKLGARVVDSVMGRTAANKPVFPAHYDKCYATAISKALSRWESAEVQPLYCGATYFKFSALLQQGYLVYENQIERRRVANLATHYLVIATA